MNDTQGAAIGLIIAGVILAISGVAILQGIGILFLLIGLVAEIISSEREWRNRHQ